VISLAMFVVLFGLAIWLDLKDRAHIAGIFSPCLLRLIALLGLTLGLGIGYMTARALGG
jgi:ABC-type polysaccharide/polyol phosphate export permease